MSTNTGGPAFARPATLYPSNRPASTEQTGMTIRDYFIANAPEHPQPWFTPVMPPKPDSTACVSDDGQRFYDDQWAASKVEGDNFQRVNQAEIDQWEADYVKQKYVQWPAAWADEQIKARTKMSDKDTSGPAFPSSPAVGPNDSIYRPVDIGCEGMTLRQYAAIKLKVPDSGIDWLDEMITKSLRDDFAAKALPALISNLEACLVDAKEGPELCLVGNEGGTPDLITENAYAMADAMLRERSK